MDTSIVYDCLYHDLLISKLEANSISKAQQENQAQRTKIGSSCSSWYNLIQRDPQGSILGPLLSNIFIYLHICFYFYFFIGVIMIFIVHAKL